MQANLHAAEIFSLIDLTSLNDTDNQETILALCKKAIWNNTSVAAVCVYPKFVEAVRIALANTPIKIAAVANFPYAVDPLDQVMEVIHQTILSGANEIDVVFPYLSYLKGDKKNAFDFIHACKNVCGERVTLKVILETGALQDLPVIAEVSEGVCLAGADFLKTSTGKITIGATPEAAAVMLKTIKALSARLHRAIGFKVSGGVRTLEQAGNYIGLAQQIMGSDWVRPEHFRIGASQLVDQLQHL